VGIPPIPTSKPVPRQRTEQRPLPTFPGRNAAPSRRYPDVDVRLDRRFADERLRGAGRTASGTIMVGAARHGHESAVTDCIEAPARDK